jgi:catechol 2,3-dioxygenase-like lactoylglutathione lyase family enzyme
MSLELEERAVAQPDVTTYEDHDPSAKRPVLNHFGLITGNLDPLVDWYLKVLGAQINLRLQPGRGAEQGPERVVFLGNDEVHHRLTIIELGGVTANRPERHKYARTQHSAWEYESIADLLQSYERLRNLGIEPVFCGHHGTHVYFFYLDPDENLVELLADGWGDHEKSLEYFRTSSAIRTENMGALIDPEKMLAVWRNEGLSEADLSQRSFAGEWWPERPWDPTVLS